jgi:hypothetical protein
MAAKAAAAAVLLVLLAPASSSTASASGPGLRRCVHTADVPARCGWQEWLLLLLGQRQAVRSRCNHLAPCLLLLPLVLPDFVAAHGVATVASCRGMLVCMGLLLLMCSAASPRGFGLRADACVLCVSWAAGLLLLCFAGMCEATACCSWPGFWTLTLLLGVGPISAVLRLVLMLLPAAVVCWLLLRGALDTQSAGLPG